MPTNWLGPVGPLAFNRWNVSERGKPSICAIGATLPPEQETLTPQSLSKQVARQGAGAILTDRERDATEKALQQEPLGKVKRHCSMERRVICRHEIDAPLSSGC